MDIFHDLLQTFLSVIERPGVTFSILLHFQRRSRYATSVGCFAGAISDLRIKENLDAFRSGRHVGAFANSDTAIFDEHCRVSAINLILGRRRHGYLTWNFPYVALGYVLGVLAILSIVLDAAALNFLELLQQRQINALLIIDVTVGVRAGNDLATELVDLLSGVDCNVTGA